MEHRTAAHPKGVCHHEQGGGLHLRGQHSQALPRLPLRLKLIRHRHARGRMLPVEGVLALHNARVPAPARALRRLGKGGEHAEVCHRRVFDGGILPAGALHAHRAGCHHKVPALDVQPDAAAGAHPDEGVRADCGELLHGDGCRRPADAGGGHADLLPQEGAGVGGVLPVGHHVGGIVKIGRDLGTAAGVARQDAVAAHIPLLAVDMKLPLRWDHTVHLIIIVPVLPRTRFAPGGPRRPMAKICVYLILLYEIQNCKKTRCLHSCFFPSLRLQYA